jgi:hypothetical protein
MTLPKADLCFASTTQYLGLHSLTKMKSKKQTPMKTLMTEKRSKSDTKGAKPGTQQTEPVDPGDQQPTKPIKLEPQQPKPIKPK